MNIDIRKSVIENFKDTNKEEIINNIEDCIKENNELTLPGMGVFFEILWKNSNDNLKKEIIDTIISSL